MPKNHYRKRHLRERESEDDEGGHDRDDDYDDIDEEDKEDSSQEGKRTDLFMCADSSCFLGFCHWEDLGLRDLMKVVKLHTTFMAHLSSARYLGSLISIDDFRSPLLLLSGLRCLVQLLSTRIVEEGHIFYGLNPVKRCILSEMIMHCHMWRLMSWSHHSD
ncbi:hypothetical protein RHGRI_007110 [Rhododendron griersonianum]|uniref:Uncharacterized protein n=1 Tax=Rhododendron griersonianum TaxID=479676 RepID=A0AAV6KWT5_9ERIC|nr:hypothetical protein RHGRI_007110 [Rhododendron griersonianum]